jgi:hypothetical protein
MIIAAFDLATVTGVCDGPVGSQPRVFSWFLADEGDTRPARLHSLWAFLTRYLEQERCDGVVYEAPMPLGVIAGKPGREGFKLSEANVSFARGAIGVLEERCYAHGKPVEDVSVQDARESVLGWRTNRDKSINTKKRVMRDVKTLGVLFENENEADAYVVWQCACNRQNPRLAVAQTPLFRVNYPP